MERADVASLVNSLREAFLGAGPEVREKGTVTGHAFLVDGRPLGRVDVRVNVVRIRLWLADKDRRSFEGRPTFDPDSGWLHVVSPEDVTFAKTLLASAYRTAASGDRAAPPGGRGETAKAATATEPVAPAPEKRKRAASATLSRTKRTRG